MQVPPCWQCHTVLVLEFFGGVRELPLCRLILIYWTERQFTAPASISILGELSEAAVTPSHKMVFGKER